MSRDRKIETLADLPLAVGRSRGDVATLARLADLTTIPAGTVLHGGERRSPWSYYVLDGTALVSHGETPLAVATHGAWLIGDRHGEPTSATIVIASDLHALAFRPHELTAAADALPGLLPAIALPQ